MNRPRVAVLIPCRNEEQTIGAVVDAYRRALPGATVYVFDNDSADATVQRAGAAGAVVRSVLLPGKGNVVRRMFADVEADCYIVVDGDGTYDASLAPRLVSLVASGHDLVSAARRPVGEQAFRAGHTFGNRLLGGLLTRLFGRSLDDVLSGYKACSRRLVKSFPIVSGGFEIETELVVHALQLNVSVREVEGDYRARPSGSVSKLGTWSDGTKILRAIVGLVRRGRPLAFFGAIGLVLAVLGVALGIPVLATFLHVHRVPRFPTAVLATGLEVTAALSFTAGLVLDTVSHARREQRTLAFLALPGPMLPPAGTVELGNIPAAAPADDPLPQRNTRVPFGVSSTR